MAYASRSLKTSKRNYPAHKLEFLALKWAITDKFKDYLYGATFDVVTDNNPLTYVFTTAKLDATGQRWLAELSNYNCSISYRSGKQNAYADGLSTKKPETETKIFPDVFKGICPATICKAITVDDVSLSDVLTDPEDETSTEPDHDQEVPTEVLQGTALTSRDWYKAQSSDSNISVLIDSIIEGKRPSSKDNSQLDKRFLLAWDNFRLKDGLLYKKATINGEDVQLLPKFFLDSDFCHNYLHTPVILN